MITLQVRLFSWPIGEDPDEDDALLAGLEEAMNDFLRHRDAKEIKKIYIAHGDKKRTALIAYDHFVSMREKNIE